MDDGLKCGDPIPGSKLVRDFCVSCHEPMRVAPQIAGHRNYCTDCRWGYLEQSISGTSVRRIEIDSEGDAGFGSYYDQATTRADQG
jgi:hypothetical protein